MEPTAYESSVAEYAAGLRIMATGESQRWEEQARQHLAQAADVLDSLLFDRLIGQRT